MLTKVFTVLVMSSVLTFAPLPSQAAEHAGGRDSNQEQASIVGSWMGTFEDGERLLISFTSDGIVLSSVQMEVNATNPVLTPGHGVWTRMAGREFAFADVVIFYDIQTGDYRGWGRLRGLLMFDEDGNLNGNNIVEVFDPTDVLVVALPHPFQLRRIGVDPLD